MKHTKGIAVLAALLCLVTVPAPTGSHADSFPAYSGNEWAMLKIVIVPPIKHWTLSSILCVLHSEVAPDPRLVLLRSLQD